MPNLKISCYLDNHTITQPLSSIIEESSLLYKMGFGVLSAPHKLGKGAYFRAENAIHSLYETFDVKEEDHFIFTSGDQETFSRLFLSLYLDLVKESGKNHFLITPFAEAPLICALNHLENFNCSGKIVPLTSTGLLDLKQLEELLRPRTLLLSLPLSCGLTGIIQQVEEIVKICHEKGVLLHLDVSSSIGKIDLSFTKMGVDILSFDGSRLHAPPGSGGIFIKKGISLPSLQTLDAHLNSIALVGLSMAAKTAKDRLDATCMETARLRDLFEKEITSYLPEVSICAQNQMRLPNISTLIFPGIESEALLFLLNRKEVFGSRGGGYSPCLSYILESFGMDKEKASSALSFNLSFQTTEEEILYAAKCVIACVHKLHFIKGEL